jgi:hypothetical protein
MNSLRARGVMSFQASSAVEWWIRPSVVDSPAPAVVDSPVVNNRDVQYEETFTAQGDSASQTAVVNSLSRVSTTGDEGDDDPDVGDDDHHVGDDGPDVELWREKLRLAEAGWIIGTPGKRCVTCRKFANTLDPQGRPRHPHCPAPDPDTDSTADQAQLADQRNPRRGVVGQLRGSGSV